MKKQLTIKTLILFVALLQINNVIYSQEKEKANKLTAIVNDLAFGGKQAEHKIIHIRFINCSKVDFELISAKSISYPELELKRKAYSPDGLFASFIYSKSNEITTHDVQLLFKQLNISHVLFNEKKITTDELSKYHFSIVDLR